MNSQRSLLGLDRQHLSPHWGPYESPINYLLLHELVSTVIHTEEINILNSSSNPTSSPSNISRQHKSASVGSFIHEGACGGLSTAEGVCVRAFKPDILKGMERGCNTSKAWPSTVPVLVWSNSGFSQYYMQFIRKTEGTDQERCQFKPLT